MTLQVNLKQLKADGASNNYVLSWSNTANSWTTVNVASVIVSGNSSVAGTLQIVDSYANTSATIAASANSVKTAYDTAVTAQNMAANAYSNAASVAATAYSNAVSTASSDATTKAGTAYSNAVSYADTKAATAYSNATSYADTVAATAYSNAASKAAAAYTNAVAYAASNTYVNSTFAPLAGATFTGAVTVSNTLATGNTTVTGFANVTGTLQIGGQLTVGGNLVINGTTTTVNTSSLNVTDSLIYLASNNEVSDTLDIGFVGHYNNGAGANGHTGLFRSASTKKYYLFQNYQPEFFSNNNVDIANTATGVQMADIVVGNLVANSTLTVTGNATFSNTISVTGLITGTITTANNATNLGGQAASYYAANSQLANYALLAGATFTGAVVISSNTLAAGNTTITGKLTANTGLLSANTIQFNDGSQQTTYIDPIAMAIALG